MMVTIVLETQSTNMVDHSEKEPIITGKFRIQDLILIVNKYSGLQNVINNTAEYPRFFEKFIESTPNEAFYQKGKALYALSPEWRKYREICEEDDGIDDL